MLQIDENTGGNEPLQLSGGGGSVLGCADPDADGAVATGFVPPGPASRVLGGGSLVVALPPEPSGDAPSVVAPWPAPHAGTSARAPSAAAMPRSAARRCALAIFA